MQVKEAWEILGLDVGNYDDLKREYRRLAKVHHPDKQGHNPEIMSAITRAFQLLVESQELSLLKVVKSTKTEAAHDKDQRFDEECAEAEAEFEEALAHEEFSEGDEVDYQLSDQEDYEPLPKATKMRPTQKKKSPPCPVCGAPGVHIQMIERTCSCTACEAEFKLARPLFDMEGPEDLYFAWVDSL